jgi:type I restriction enzyme S subunit
MNIVKLTDVCDFQGGTQPPKSDWIKDPKSGYIRMLQIRDFTQRERNNIEYVKAKATLKTCNESDILIGRYGASIGKICSGLEGAYNVALVKTIPNNNLLNRDFLLYVLKGEDFQNFIQNIGSRAAQAGFNKADLEGFQFPLPSLSQQQKIANILDAADALRKNDKALIEKYDELLKANINKLLGEALNRDVKSLKSGDTEFLANGFTWYELTDITEVISDIDHKMPKSVNHGKLFLSAKDLLDNGELDFSKPKYISEEDFRHLSRKIKPRKGDIIYSRIGAKLGKARLVKTDHDFIVSYSCCTIRPNHEKVSSIYLRYILDSEFTLKQANHGTKGIGVPDLGMGEIRSFKIPVPELMLGNKLEKELILIEQQKAIAQKSLEKSEELFNSLLQKAFKGELV